MIKDKKRLETILRYRIKGYTLQTIGKILHLTKARIGKIIEDNKNNPEFRNLYIEVDKTKAFLNRKIKI